MTSLFDQIEGALHLGIEASTTLKAEEACANALTALQDFRKRIPEDLADSIKGTKTLDIPGACRFIAASMLHEADKGV